MSSDTIKARVTSIEKKLERQESGGPRLAYSFGQLVLAAQRSRGTGETDAEALALMGPPEETLEPGEKSAEQLILETGFPEQWDEERWRIVEELERERLESMER